MTKQQRVERALERIIEEYDIHPDAVVKLKALLRSLVADREAASWPMKAATFKKPLTRNGNPHVKNRSENHYPSRTRAHLYREPACRTASNGLRHGA